MMRKGIIRKSSVLFLLLIAGAINGAASFASSSSISRSRQTMRMPSTTVAKEGGIAHQNQARNEKLGRTPAFFHLSSTSNKNNESNDTNELETILLSTLLSVEDCIACYEHQERNNGRISSAVKFIDASWWHKGELNGREMFEKGPRVPDSYYMDMDDIATQGEIYPDLNPKNLPHMLPPKELFSSTMDYYTNIRNTDHIIIYARESVIFTPRTWFLFKSMGHDATKIHLMQGSLEEWIEQGGPVEKQQVTVPRARDILQKRDKVQDDYSGYVARAAEYVCDMKEVLDTTLAMQGENTDSNIIIDPRGSSFAKGHIPGSIHIPYLSFVQPDNTLKFKTKEEIIDVFADAGISLEDDILNEDKKIICSCGSGVSVCHIFLALELCGRNVEEQRKTLIYDGSWAEWGADESTPKQMS